MTPEEDFFILLSFKNPMNALAFVHSLEPERKGRLREYVEIEHGRLQRSIRRSKIMFAVTAVLFTIAMVFIHYKK